MNSFILSKNSLRKWNPRQIFCHKAPFAFRLSLSLFYFVYFLFFIYLFVCVCFLHCLLSLLYPLPSPSMPSPPFTSLHFPSPCYSLSHLGDLTASLTCCGATSCQRESCCHKPHSMPRDSHSTCTVCMIDPLDCA